MVTDKPTVKYKKDEIIHTPSLYNINRGLGIEGTTWSVEHDGTANFTSLKIGNETIDLNKNFDDRYIKLIGGTITGDITTTYTDFTNTSLVTKSYVDYTVSNIDLSAFIPNEGNTTSDIFNLHRVEMFLNGADYLGLSSDHDLDIASRSIEIIADDRDSQSQIILNSKTGDIILNTGYTSYSDGATEHPGGKIYYTICSREPTANDEIATIGSINTVLSNMDLSNYIPNEGNLKYDKSFTLVRNSYMLSVNDSNAAVGNTEFHIGDKCLSFRSTHNLPELYIYDGSFDIKLHENSNNEAQFTILGGDSNPVFTYYYKKVNNVINQSIGVGGMKGNIELLNDGNITLMPVNNGIVTVKGYIRDEGNTVSNGVPFNIVRSGDISLSTNSGNLTLKGGTTTVTANQGKLTINTNSPGNIEVKAIYGDILLTPDSTHKSYYGTAVPEDEIATKGDVSDLETRFNDLLVKYNDLVERLNDFLDMTGPQSEPEPEPIVEHTFVTVPLTTVTIPMQKQNMANAFTIDWGDGTIEDTSDKPVYTQQDWQNKEFTLTHTYETEEIHYIDFIPNDPDNELCTGELGFDIDLSQFTEMNLENIMVDAMSDNDTITKLSINTWLTYFGCGNVLFDGLSELNEFKLGPKSKYVECFFVSNAPKLEKITLDVTDDFHMGMNDYAGDNAFLYDGSEEDALNEIHCTSEIPFSMSNDSWFRSIDYEWNGGRVIKDNLDLTIYVPANSVNLYKYANGWNRYAPYIQAEPGTVKTRHTLVTVPTNSVSITMAQYMDNAFTIDWGDGSPIEKTGTHGTDQWNYPNEFTLTHNYSTNEIHYIDIIPNDINNELCAGTISYDTDLTQFTEMDLENIDPPNSGSDNTTITKLSMNMPKSFMGSGAPGINGYIGLNEIKYGDRFVEMVYNYISLYDNTNNPKIILGMNKDIVFYYSDQESCQYIIDCDNNSTNEIHCTSKVPFNLAGFNGEQVFLRSIDYDWVGSDAVPKQDLSDLTIYVPAESVNAYKAASSWAPYINCIQAEP